MKTIGFVISKKENERRRAILPQDLSLIKHPEQLYIEEGYGNVLGLTDANYAACGCHIVSRTEVLQCDIICDPKAGDAEYLSQLHRQTIFGWIHAIQNKDITDTIIASELSGYAWEDMYEKGRHCFWRNNEIAGEAAVFHAYMCHGILPYHTKAAVLGRGNIARGAIKTLNYLGADVTQYNHKMERLFQQELGQYDVIVNAILWDTTRKDHIIYQKDLCRMKENALIIDISCDRHGGIETSEPTTIDSPIYQVDGITHYVVDHTPSIFWKTASESISRAICPYLDALIEDNADNSEVLSHAHNFQYGQILDPRINQFQGR